MYKLLIVTKFNGNVATSIAEFSTQELAERGGQCLVNVKEGVVPCGTKLWFIIDKRTVNETVHLCAQCKKENSGKS